MLRWQASSSVTSLLLWRASSHSACWHASFLLGPPNHRNELSIQHASGLAAANFTMPAMSPTMTEGNIASWKVKEGDSFSTGDVLLEIETDKATMDVEAQGKQLT